MGRIWKILSVCVVLVIAVVVSGVAVLMSMDFNEYRGLVSEQVKDFTGRDLAIAGELNLRISLSPALTVEGVTFANAAWGSRPEMAKLKRLAVEIELLPLLTGQVHVKRLVLVGLDALLETDAKGRGNWIFDEQPSGKEEDPEEAKESGDLGVLPVVRKVHIEDLTFTYLDGVSKQRMTASLDTLELAADGLDSPLHLNLKGLFNNVSFSADGQLGSVKNLIEGDKPFPISMKAGALGASVKIDGA
ncbi:MAG: AsmA family protein, partial [Rhodospirillales bacterium]